MAILVENDQQKQLILALCSAACKGGDLNIAKAAVVVAESLQIIPAGKEAPKTPEEAPKTPEEALKPPEEAPKTPEEAPKTPEEAPKTEAPLVPRL